MWMKFTSATGTRVSRRRRDRRTATCLRKSLCFERLEPREVLSADLTAVAVHALAGYAVPGRTLAVQTQVANNGPGNSGQFTVEYRLSKDAVLGNADDRAVGRATRVSLGPGGSALWTQTLAIPSAVTHANYYVGVVVTASTDTNRGNNTAIDSATTSILYTSLGGTVTYNGSTKSVSIRAYSGSATPIFDDRPSWIVIHGRNSSPSSANLVQLETTLDAHATKDQVLVLDWSQAAASGLIGGAGENYIKPVAKWASSVLTAYGLMPDELNLVGHSWGAYVAAELAELETGAAAGPVGYVNSILALDPAMDYPGSSYNPTAAGEVNFARNSKFSWAFYASGGLYGSSTTAQTADESFVVTRSDHSKLVNVVANAVAVNFGSQFDVDRLLAGTASTTWVANRYDSSGRRSPAGKFDAVLTATSDGLRAYSLKYFNMMAEVIVYS